MEAVFLRFLGAAPLDVSPPLPEAPATPDIGAIIILGAVVVAVIMASIFVIRRIKKRRANQEHP